MDMTKYVLWLKPHCGGEILIIQLTDFRQSVFTWKYINPKIYGYTTIWKWCADFKPISDEKLLDLSYFPVGNRHKHASCHNACIRTTKKLRKKLCREVQNVRRRQFNLELSNKQLIWDARQFGGYWNKREINIRPIQRKLYRVVQKSKQSSCCYKCIKQWPIYR